MLDTQRCWPTDWFVGSDQHGLWLDLAHVSVDAEELLRDVGAAAAEHEAGRDDRAAEILLDLEARPRGEAFEDEPGEPWADPLREQVRAAWVRSLQFLVAIRRRQGRGGDVVRLLVHLLAVDPYDERAHRQLVRTLVASRRYGEARRAFDRWAAAMTDLDALRRTGASWRACRTPGRNPF